MWRKNVAHHFSAVLDFTLPACARRRAQRHRGLMVSYRRSVSPLCRTYRRARLRPARLSTLFRLLGGGAANGQPRAGMVLPAGSSTHHWAAFSRATSASSSATRCASPPTERSTYFAVTSTSRLTASPTALRGSVMCACGGADKRPGRVGWAASPLCRVGWAASPLCDGRRGAPA